MKPLSLFIASLILILAYILPARNSGDPVLDSSLTPAIADDESINFDSWFIDKTMRLDYFHSGNSKEEHFAVD